jgi:hypothetical protein
MKMRFKIKLLWLFFFALCFAGCQKSDDHNEIASQDLSMKLLEAISQQPDLSKFYEYLQKTGLDKEIASSKTYTVWAPVNAALQSLDAAIIADPAKLKQFIGNHISSQTYFTRNASSPIRVPMLNGKRVSFSNKIFDEATITQADKYVANGVLHVIDKAAPVYPNAWELVNNTKTSFQQSAFILTLTRKVFDATNAIVDSINSQTGKPIYRPGTDSVLRNSFNYEVYDLQNEEKLYTYFILNDAAFTTEVNKLLPYFKTSTTDSTKELASNAVVKDLIVEGLYTIDQLPATLTSKSGVTIPIDKNKIVETRRMSNGIAYVMTGVNFDAKTKIPSVVVQGENYLGFFDANGNAVNPRQNNVSSIFLRARVNKTTGTPYTDIFVYNHGVSNINAQYQITRLPSVKYKVYWVAVNDSVVINLTDPRFLPAPFSQRLAMGVRGANFLPLTPATGMLITPYNYSEVYLGDYTKTTYGTLDMFLTANGTTPLTLDYIKLVPDL